jgi:hypothetical protein
VEALLSGFYKMYSLVQFDTLFREENYHVIRHNGCIVAGCQYYRVHWVIRKMPGWFGKVIMKVLPKLPLIKRIFNPNKFEFIAFDAIYLKPGFENELSKLFEHILAVENLHSALLWLGSTSSLKWDIQTKIKLGILHKFVEDSNVYCMVRAENFSDQDLVYLKGSSVYASAFDFI